MAKQTNKFIIAEYVDSNRADIIQRYADDMPIPDIADLYGVAMSTIYLRLVKWGVRIKRCVRAKRRSNERPQRQKREFSPELKAKMAENTRINNEHIKHCEFKHKTGDQKLIAGILIQI